MTDALNSTPHDSTLDDEVDLHDDALAEPTAPADAAQAAAPAAAEHAPVDKADATPAADAADTDDADDASADHADPSEDNIRLGTISGVRGEFILVDFKQGDAKVFGLCPVAAFKKVPRVGEHIDFLVVSTDEDGTLRIDRAPATARVGWKSLNRGDTIDVVVTGMNIGGLEVKIPHTKVRGFMPSSQIDLTPAEDLAAFLGKTLHVKAVEVNPRKKRLVVSRRALLEIGAREARLATLREGEVLDGVVRNIASFGVFVEIAPGVDGLVRMGDLAWNHVEKAEDVVKPGEAVKVRVVGVDRKHGKLSLSIRATQPNPWDELATKYPIGSKQSGKVVKCAEFGAFVELEPGIEGMIHISQLADRRIEKTEHAVREGQTVQFIVREIDARRHRISLSIRALTAPQESTAGEASRDDIRKYTKREKDARAMESLMAKFGGDGLKGGIG